MALVQFANVRVLKHLARFYIWVIRGIPLLVQLYIVFYGLPRACLKIAFRQMCVPLCGRFGPNERGVAGYVK